MLLSLDLGLGVLNTMLLVVMDQFQIQVMLMDQRVAQQLQPLRQQQLLVEAMELCVVEEVEVQQEPVIQV